MLHSATVQLYVPAQTQQKAEMLLFWFEKNYVVEIK